MPCDADLLLVNANVLTMDPARPRARAVAVAGGRITGVYDGRPDVTATNVMDLRGLTLIPGFYDAHNHMVGFGLSLTEIDLRVGSLDELYARVAAKAATTPAGEWIIGAGYDQNKTGAHPHRDALDPIAPRHRVWLKHTSSHMCVVNSRVLEDLGIGETAPGVDGGRVTTDPAGRPTGLLEERAQQLVGDLTRPYPLATLTDAVAAAAERYLAEGITSVTEAGLGGGWIGQSPVELAAYVAAREQRRLPLNRRTATGAPFNDAEAVTPAEALRAYTWGSAYASKQERIKGSITPGKLADLTVLSEDPTTVAPDRIASLEIAATLVDGVLRYAAPGLVTR